MWPTLRVCKGTCCGGRQWGPPSSRRSRSTSWLRRWRPPRATAGWVTARAAGWVVWAAGWVGGLQCGRQGGWRSMLYDGNCRLQGVWGACSAGCRVGGGPAVQAAGWRRALQGGWQRTRAAGWGVWAEVRWGQVVHSAAAARPRTPAMAPLARCAATRLQQRLAPRKAVSVCLLPLLCALCFSALSPGVQTTHQLSPPLHSLCGEW